MKKKPSFFEQLYRANVSVALMNRVGAHGEIHGQKTNR